MSYKVFPKIYEINNQNCLRKSLTALLFYSFALVIYLTLTAIGFDAVKTILCGVRTNSFTLGINILLV